MAHSTSRSSPISPALMGSPGMPCAVTVTIGRPASFFWCVVMAPTAPASADTAARIGEHRSQRPRQTTAPKSRERPADGPALRVVVRVQPRAGSVSPRPAWLGRVRIFAIANFG